MDPFLAYAMQQGTVFQGYQPAPRGGLIPGLGPLNAMAQPLMQQMFGGMGLVPAQFLPTQNLYDQFRDQQRRRQVFEATAEGAQADQETYERLIRGAYDLTGTQVGLSQRRTIRTLSRDITQLSPIAAQFAPQLFDALHGSQGSAAVMSRFLMEGGRYAVDPVTGAQGLTPETVGSLADAITERLYGSSDAIQQMRGVGRGELGAMFDELQRRGAMPSSIAARPRDDQLRMLEEAGAGTMEELRQLDQEGLGEKLRQFDEERITTRLKDMAGVVSAMRDIFGDLGMPNAPMNQIINGLNALTQGGLATLPPGELEMMVRQTKALAENTGVSVGAVMGLTSQAANLADQIGLDRSIAVQAGQHGVAFGQAYATSFGGTPVFGAMDKERLVAEDTRLTTQAAGSEVTNAMGAFLRADESFGFDPNSRAGRLAEAIRTGATEFEGRPMGDVLRHESLREVMRQSGVSAEDVGAFNRALSDPFGNQEFIQENNLGSLGRQLQGQVDIMPRILRPAGRTAVRSSLMDAGMDQDQAVALSRQVGGELGQALLNIPDLGDIESPQARQELVEDVLSRHMDAGQAAQLAPSVAMNFFSRVNRTARELGHGNAVQLVQKFSPRVLRQERMVQQTARTEAELSRALSPLGRAGPLRRISNIVQNADTDEDLGRMLGQALGGIPVENAEPLKQAIQDFRQLDELDENGNLTEQGLRNRREALRRIHEQVGEIVDKAEEDPDLDVGRQLGDEDYERVAETGRRLAASLQDGLPEDAEERAEYRETVGRQTGMFVERSRRLTDVLLGDEKSMERLGRGGLEMVTGIEDKRLRLQRLGEQHGGLQRLLTGTDLSDEEMEAREEAMRLQGEITRDIETVQSRMKRGGQPEMTEEERERLEELIDRRTSSLDEQAQATLGELAEAVGIDEESLSGRDRKEMMELIGRGDRQLDVRRALSAREQLAEAAEEAGMSLPEFLEEPHSAEEQELIDQAGSLLTLGTGTRDDAVAAMDALRQFAGGMRDDGGAAAEEPDVAQAPNSVTVENVVSVRVVDEPGAEDQTYGDSPLFG